MERESKPRVVLVRPETDSDALVLSNWAEVVRSEPACFFVNLKGKAASRKRLNSELTVECSACFFFCHGTKSALIGNEENLLDEANANLADRLFVVAIACHSAKELGVSVISKGATGFLGFSDRLVWIPAFADEFGHAAVAGAQALIRGGTLADSSRAMHQSYKDLVEEFKGTKGPNSMMAAIAAFWNQEHIVVKGDLTAVLRTGRQSVGAG